MNIKPNLPPDKAYRPATWTRFWGLPVAFLAGFLVAYLLLPADRRPEPEIPEAERIAIMGAMERLAELRDAGMFLWDDFNVIMKALSLNCCTNPKICGVGTCGPCYRCNPPPVKPPGAEAKP